MKTRGCRHLPSIVVILALLLSTAGALACRIEFPGMFPAEEERPPEEWRERPPEERPLAEPPPGEPPAEEPPPGEVPGQGEQVQVEFVADPPSIPRGQCTILHWQVFGAGDYTVILNGQQVQPSGERKECPEDTRNYELIVEGPGGPVVKSAMVQVFGEGEERPPEPGPEEPKPEEPKPQEPPPAEPPPPTQAPPAQAQPTQKAPSPAKTPTPTTPPPPGGGSWGVQTADIAPTDVYPDNQPWGKLWVRVTNKGGPNDLRNAPITINVTASAMLRSTQSMTGTISQPSYTTNINLDKNQTLAINTGMDIDTSQWIYQQVTVQIVVDQWTDPDTSNNVYVEKGQPWQK